MRKIELAGTRVPVIGQGTWRMGKTGSSVRARSRRCVRGWIWA